MFPLSARVCFRDIQQQYLLLTLRHSKPEPIHVIQRRNIKCLRKILIKRGSTIPYIIIFDFFWWDQ